MFSLQIQKSNNTFKMNLKTQYVVFESPLYSLSHLWIFKPIHAYF